MPSNFISYSELLGLNADELKRMEADAERRWQEAQTADSAAQEALGRVGAEGYERGATNARARGAGWDVDNVNMQGLGSYSDYVSARNNASAQWKAWRESQKGAQRGMFEQAAFGQSKAGQLKDSEDDWKSAEAATQDNITSRETFDTEEAQQKERVEQLYRQANAAQIQRDKYQKDIEAMARGGSRGIAVDAPYYNKLKEGLDSYGSEYTRLMGEAEAQRKKPARTWKAPTSGPTGVR